MLLPMKQEMKTIVDRLDQIDKQRKQVDETKKRFLDKNARSLEKTLKAIDGSKKRIVQRNSRKLSALQEAYDLEILEFYKDSFAALFSTAFRKMVLYSTDMVTLDERGREGDYFCRDEDKGESCISFHHQISGNGYYAKNVANIDGVFTDYGKGILGDYIHFNTATYYGFGSVPAEGQRKRSDQLYGKIVGFLKKELHP
jgi:hypothetical protein